MTKPFQVSATLVSTTYGLNWPAAARERAVEQGRKARAIRVADLARDVGGGQRARDRQLVITGLAERLQDFTRHRIAEVDAQRDRQINVGGAVGLVDLVLRHARHLHRQRERAEAVLAVDGGAQRRKMRLRLLLQQPDRLADIERRAKRRIDLAAAASRTGHARRVVEEDAGHDIQADCRRRRGMRCGRGEGHRHCCDESDCLEAHVSEPPFCNRSCTA